MLFSLHLINQNVFSNVYQIYSAAKDFATCFIEVNVTTEPYEASLLWLLWYVKCAGGSMRIYSTSNGGQVKYDLLS